MPNTLISVDLNESPHTNEKVHNRWHPDIPMADWVSPGDDFLVETYDWTGGQIKNNDDASDVRDVELPQVHYLSGPIGVRGAAPGDLLVVDILDIGAKDGQPLGLQRLLLQAERRRFSDRSLPAGAEDHLGLPRHVHQPRGMCRG